MRTFLFFIACTFFATSLLAQDSTTYRSLENVVITGQYRPQSIRNSVYQVRVINNERIRLSGATSIQQVLTTQLGFRFSNDNTLGTTDVSLMGASGRNIKILLDGVPLIDRNDARESLGQIDIQTIDRIEIVEGPLSVSYGTDALAGVINIITKKPVHDALSVTARVQEETAGNEYYPFSYKGQHTQHVSINWKKKRWSAQLGGTHNEFDGFGGDEYGRAKTWRPKEQWQGNARIGYSRAGFDLYYRLDGLHETITDNKAINLSNYKAVNKSYVTDRYLHQLQSAWQINSRWSLNNVLSYTDYQRQTHTIVKNLANQSSAPSSEPGSQDLSKLNSLLFRSTGQVVTSPKLSLQPGIEITREEASGERIMGSPSISNYAAFFSAEYKPVSKINIRPGFRIMHNSVYEAPPVVPSINTKIALGKTLDLRLAYAYGFRAPELRELYFVFVDANHNIYGNTDLKAEHSNSFTGSLGFTPSIKTIRFSTQLSGFYNVFHDQINLAVDANDPQRYSYFNIDQTKTAGGTIENRFGWKTLDLNLGFSLIGYSNNLYNDPAIEKDSPHDFLWTAEVNSALTYRLPRWKTSFAIFYKFTGRKPSFEFEHDSQGHTIIHTATTEGFHIADLTITTAVHRLITINAGIRNLFDVTTINNTALTGGTHTTIGALPMSYGRSYFLGLVFQWTKK